jgi:membrane-bound lytic murein transglycosylase B
MQRAWVITGFSTAAVLALAAGLALSASVLQPKGSAPALPMADPVDAVPTEVLEGPIDGLADRVWLAETSEATGVPERALQAYAGAVVAIQRGMPQCNLGWTTLAGVGYVESRHGTYNGATVDPDGLVTPTILGPLLDGTVYNEIRDTDDGTLDGDVTWDRAVGPLQFIPSTWKSSGHDGDINGEITPNDIDDAAYSAALYLCATAAGDMSLPDNWRQAIASYNSSLEYAIAVAKAANRYAAAVAP